MLACSLVRVGGHGCRLCLARKQQIRHCHCFHALLAPHPIPSDLAHTGDTLAHSPGLDPPLSWHKKDQACNGSYYFDQLSLTARESFLFVIGRNEPVIRAIVFERLKESLFLLFFSLVILELLVANQPTIAQDDLHV